MNEIDSGNDWVFVKNKEISYLESKLLKQFNFPHAFFTYRSKNNLPQELNVINKNSPSIHFLKQIHSNKVFQASYSEIESIITGDGLISDKKNQSLWIYSADCIPLLIGDKKRGNVAAIHCGWKGLSQNIIKNTIKLLSKNGSRREDLVAALGPAISAKKYEVSKDIFYRVCKNFLEVVSINDAESRGWISTLKKKDKFLLDLRLIAKTQLIEENLKEKLISVNQNCTYSEKHLFKSWRREKDKLRQWSFIQSIKRK